MDERFEKQLNELKAKIVERIMERQAKKEEKKEWTWLKKGDLYSHRRNLEILKWAIWQEKIFELKWRNAWLIITVTNISLINNLSFFF